MLIKCGPRALIKEKFEKLPDLSKNKNVLSGPSTGSGTEK